MQLYVNEQQRSNRGFIAALSTPHQFVVRLTGSGVPNPDAIKPEKDFSGLDASVSVSVQLASSDMVGPEGVAAAALQVQLPDQVFHVYDARNAQQLAGCSTPFSPHLHPIAIDGDLAYCQTLLYSPRHFVMQFEGVQRQVVVETPLAAQLLQYMPASVVSETKKLIKSPMTGVYCASTGLS